MSTGVGMNSCCLSGKVQNGTPKGRVEEIAGLQTYVAEPENGDKTKTVVFLVDSTSFSCSSPIPTCACKVLTTSPVFGWELPNTRLLADQYAAQGFTAYIPDVHEGDSLDIDFLQTCEPQPHIRDNQSAIESAARQAKTGATLGPWLLKHRESVSRPLVENFIDKVRYIPGTNKVGVIGFCWGGRYAILAGKKPFSGTEGKGVDAIYSCHPSLLSIPSDFEDVTVPISLALGEKDSLVGEKEAEQIKELMEKYKTENGLTSEVQIYEGQPHGFALRGDWANEKDKKAMDEAEKQGIEWFKKYLA